MAKRKRKKKSKSKQKQPRLTPGIVHEIIAISLAVVGVLLIIAFFGAGGFLVEWVGNNLQLLLGTAAYLVPALLFYLAGRVFLADRYDTNLTIYLGLLLLITAVAGLLHLMVPPNDSLLIAREQAGGGLYGYVITRATLALFNQAASAIILGALGLISIALMTNTKLADLYQRLRTWLTAKNTQLKQLLEQKRQEQKEKSKSAKVNAKVPVVSQSESATSPSTKSETSSSSEDEEEEAALVASSDSDWKLPPLDLLEDKGTEADAGDYEQNSEVIKQTLSSFNIDVEMQEINIGPTVTQYTLKPQADVKLSKINDLERNLALSLAAQSIRVEAPIPGKSAVGIEVPNEQSAVVRIKELLQTENWKSSKSPLSFVLGQGVAGQPMVGDLSRMPHLLIAGATGSGKSVMINAFIMSLLYRNSPQKLRLILVDPKRVELSLYSDIPHLLSPVITEPEKCLSALKWAVAEMERRYNELADSGKRNIAEYNAAHSKEEQMPYIVLAVDELSDLMMMASSDVESLIVRLAQKARATGIHLVLATQRPSVNVITGLIKANIPARIAFSTVSQVDSRTILDQSGAEKLLGNGDMLFDAPTFAQPKRVQGVYVSESEVNAVADFLKDESEPEYNDEVLSQTVKLGGGRVAIGDMGEKDELFEKAAELVVNRGKGSASLLQRRLRVGYARAARILDELQEENIVGPPNGSKPREVLIESLDEIEEIDSEESIQTAGEDQDNTGSG